MDESRLLRNSPRVHANMRDPEEILTRLGHFWDAHGLSKHVLDPRGPMTGKFVVLEQDHRPPVPDSRPNMPGGPTSLIRHSGFNVGFEGGLTELESDSLRSATFGADLMRKDYPDLLGPVLYSRDNYNSSSTPHMSSHLFTQNLNHFNTNMDHTRSASDFWKEHDRQVQIRRKIITDMGYGQDRQALHEAMSSDRFKDELEERRNDHIAGLTTGDDPRYLDVEFDLEGKHRKVSDRIDLIPRYLSVGFDQESKPRNLSDRIDLSTGTWAKISPGQFFPGYTP